MKDSAGVVIYVGKAKNLRSRASSYFHKAASEEIRTATWIHEIADIDFIECESEVDALLDKIAQSGIGSLTAKERARLESARAELLKRR